MKKIFIIFTCLLMLCTNVLAADNCKKQEKDETVIRGIINSASGRLSKHYLSFKEDFELFNEGDKTSVYYSIIQLEQKYNKKNIQNAEINIEYINKAKNLYEFLVEYPSEKTMTTAFVEEFDNKKIIIPDEDYDKLDEDLVNLITLINVYK